LRELDIQLQEESDTSIHIFKLSGVLGIEGARGVNELIDVCIKEKIYKIIMNITDLEFISSAGIGVFLTYITELRMKGGDIIFYGMKPDIEYIFQSLDVVDFFRNYQTLEVAKEIIQKDDDKSFQPTPTVMKEFSKDEHFSFIQKTAHSINSVRSSVNNRSSSSLSDELIE